MKTHRNQQGLERLTDVVSYRISASQRSAIEEIAGLENVGICEASRIVMQAGIKALGKTKIGA